MASLGSLIFGALVIGAIALGMAFLLDVSVNRLSVVKRSIISGLIAGFLPMSLPMAVVLLDGPDEASIVLLVLVITALIASLVVGFPTAYLFSKKRAKAREKVFDPEVFE